MTTSPSLAQPEIQSELISEALRSASVGFLVWDENRCYVAANAAACEILGTTLEELLGREVGGQTVDGLEAVDNAIASGFASGTAMVQRLDGRGPVEVFYATFTTTTAGMPFMATVIAPLVPATGAPPAAGRART
ncbi:MAG: PAS domain-containing protein [Gaiellaceae bacterium]